MQPKRILSLTFGLSGAGASVLALTQMRIITGAIIGTNITSKTLGIFGVTLMIISLLIEKYAFKNIIHK